MLTLYLIYVIYLFEFIKIVKVYLKEKSLSIYEPEIIFLLPIFFVYVLNFSFSNENNKYDFYFNIFSVGFLLFYFSLKMFKFIFLRFLKLKIPHEIYLKKLKTKKISKLELYINDILFILGVALFFIVFIKKGIPLLASDPDVARANLGMGYILWPAFTFLEMSIWLDIIYLHVNHKTTNISKIILFSKLCIAIILILFTGWRGQIIQLVLVSTLLISFFRKLKLKAIGLFLIFLLSLAFIGILRAYLSGKSLYGGEIFIQSFDILNILYLSIIYLFYRFQEHFYNFIMTIDFINNHGELETGGILKDISIIMPGKGQGLDNFLRSQILAHDWIGGGGLPPTLIGSWYVEYKIYSVIIFALFFAMIISLLYSFSLYWTKKGNKYIILFYLSSVVWGLKSVFGSIGQNFITYNGVMTIFMVFYIFLIFFFKILIIGRKA